MAKVLDPLHSENASGKIGNDVHISGRRMHIVRSRPSSTVSNTAAQIAVRTQMRGCNVQWQAITQAQRDAWEAWAKTLQLTNTAGGTKTISGHDAFVKINHLLRRAGSAYRNDPPPKISCPEPLIGTYTYTAGTKVLLVNFTVSPQDNNNQIEIVQKINQPLTRSWPRQFCRFVKFRSTSNPNVPLNNIEVGYKHTFYVRAFHSISGQQSNWVRWTFTT